jgi:hypothetical protein
VLAATLGLEDVAAVRGALQVLRRTTLAELAESSDDL